MTCGGLLRRILADIPDVFLERGLNNCASSGEGAGF